MTNTLAYCGICFCRQKFYSCRVVFHKDWLPALPTNIRLWWKNTLAYWWCDYRQKGFLPVEWSSLVLPTNIGLQWKWLTVTNTLAYCGCNYTRKKFYSCIMAFRKGWLLALPTNIRLWWKWLTVHNTLAYWWCDYRQKGFLSLEWSPLVLPTVLDYSGRH